MVRRLAILDLRSAADQPLSDPEGRCTLVYNGEIYNYRELRDELVAAGARFRTTCDTEVVLQGYLHWGEAVVERLRGMYAFTIVDRERGLALAARDPIGIKPLYLLTSGKTVALASEMRPFWRLVEPRPDPQALGELLVFGWAAGSLSNLQGVTRVAPGTLVRVPLDGGAVTERRFFDVLDTIAPRPDIGPEEADRRCFEAIAESVRAHLQSDVGYAVQLSGGVDSSLLCALANDQTPGKLITFGVDLGDSIHDEGVFREQVVARYGLEHHEVRLTGADFAAALPRAVRHMEGPVFHGGSVMLMMLCDRIRAETKVVLTGEGADELFGGYERYGRWRKLRYQEMLGKTLPGALWPPLWPLKGIRRLAGSDAASYASVLGDFHAMNRLFPALVPEPGARERASRRFRDFRDRLHAVDQTTYLEALLTRQDKMSMAASVEARVPFLHLPVVEEANALPREVRDPGEVTKPVLKRIAEAHLPHDLIYRRKNGFVLPYEEWLAAPDALAPYVDLLTTPDCRLADYGEKKDLKGVVEAFRGGQRSGLPPLWRLINVETWLRSLGHGAL
jgi:asparagine synthase (glutamine-hydrolysing)